MNARQQKRFEERYGAEPDKFYASGDIRSSWYEWSQEQLAYSSACQDEAEAVKGLVEALERLINAPYNSREKWDAIDNAAAALKAYKGE